MGQRWHDVGDIDAFSEEEPASITINGDSIAIFRQGTDVYALNDLCTHGAARLSEGFVEDGCVECPLHQGTFDLKTGAACRAPAAEAVKTYPVRVREGRVELALEEAE